MTKEFKWGDEKIQEENLNLESKIVTEKDYNNYMTNKMNSAGIFEKLRLLTEVAERDDFKQRGFSMQYYKTGERIDWCAQIQTLKN
jgi:hypothetical protein